ncbi:MAG TPA: hypothetical protein P5572_05815 [Phycisphaerae bacterium]|nr:hypothetical protein [Phycisphaerales bacterium]HRX84519.1 hypothetical protein [Phycisphaerae bacterium]
MGGYGKHSHDSGRARYNRFLERAQLEFDDMLIGDFLESDHDPRTDELAQVPVRYGIRRHSDPSDSAIVGAMLDAGVFDDSDELVPINSAIGESLFDLLELERASRSSGAAAPAVPEPEPAPPVIRPMRAIEVSADDDEEFSLLGFAQGFLIGAACAAAAIGVLILAF